jgi:hypothetical protein
MWGGVPKCVLRFKGKPRLDCGVDEEEKCKNLRMKI